MKFIDALQPVSPVDGTYPPSPRGVYLRSVREAVGVTSHSAHRVLDTGLHSYLAIEAGRMDFTDRLTWIRAELALLMAAGPGWAGEDADHHLRGAAYLIGRSYFPSCYARSHKLTQSWTQVDLAAKTQIHTLKRGILYRLAGELALEAGPADAEGATFLAENGLSDRTPTGPRVGPMAPWLTAGLQAVLDEARAMMATTATEVTA